MGRRLRYIPPGSVVEITARAMHSRKLLRPSPELNDLILGIIGRAQTYYDVQVHAFTFLSTHYHMLLTPADTKALADFMRFVNSNIAREAGRMYDWHERFWSGRYQAIVVADDESEIARLRYILAHGCKEVLVAQPASWPGVNCADALTAGTPLTGTWIDRSALHEANRWGKEVDESSFCTTYHIRLSPLPCCADMTPDAYRAWCAALVADIEQETAATNVALDRHPPPRDELLRRNPHERPHRIKRSPAPLVHAATRRARERFVAAYRTFVDMFRAAAERLRLGARDVEFPPGAFPPSAPFVSPAPRILSMLPAG